MFPTEFVGDKVEVRKYLEENARKGKIAWTALNGGPFFDMCKSFVEGLLLFFLKFTSEQGLSSRLL